MATAPVYARIDEDLKNQAESILNQLGVTPNALIQMLYRQVILTQSIPFEVKLPYRTPTSLEDLTPDQFDLEMQKGYDAIQEGRTFSADEVDQIMSQEFHL